MGDIRYTAILSAEDYGTFDLFVTYATLLLPLINWQLDQGLFRFMLDYRGNKDEQKKLFSTLLLSSTVQNTIYVVLFICIEPFLKIENAYFLLLYVVLQVYNALFLQFVRGLGYSIKYTIASFISASATTVLNVIALVFLRMGLQGLFVSTLTAQLLTLVYLVISSRSWEYFSLKNARIGTFKRVGTYSIPLIPNNLAWWVVNASDRTIISHFLGTAANGIYSVANKFPNVFINFYNILNEENTTIMPPEKQIVQDDRDARAEELESAFSYDGYQVVRKELFAHLRDPAIVIRKDSITFNTACITGLEDVVYVHVMFNNDLKRIVVRGCDENDKDALRWCVAKPDKRKSRKMSCKPFATLVYQKMGWDSECRYKMLGYRITFEGETLYVFDLLVPEIFHEGQRKKNAVDSQDNAASTKPVNSRKGFYLDDIVGTFGVPVEEHRKESEVKQMDGYVSMGILTGKIAPEAGKD